jgi:hypothetical protein
MVRDRKAGKGWSHPPYRNLVKSKFQAWQLVEDFGIMDLMPTRKPASKSVEKDVLTASRRRCCLCVYLIGGNEVRKGQIAHLNRDSSDSRFENLVFLCLEHHDEYDTRTSQSKGFSSEEVRGYRDRLYSRNKEVPVASDAERIGQAAELDSLSEVSEYADARKRFPEELNFTSHPWRYSFWQVANQPDFFSYKAKPADGVCLIERIDLPDGRIVIVCIETGGNPGTSITNCVEDLCFQVCERFEIPADRLVWLEHYDYDKHDEWSMVIFRRMPPHRPFEDPQWFEMTSKMWRQLGLKPKKKLEQWHGHYLSKVEKLFDWPDKAI